MYAVNLVDLHGHKQDSPQHAAMLMVLTKHLDMANPVQCEGRRVDTDAVPMTCPDEQAEALIRLIRQRLRKDQLRIYTNANGGWKRV